VKERPQIVGAILLGLMLATSSPAGAQADGAVELIVKAGRPLRVALDERVKVTRPGQPVVGTVVEPIYAYDRIVVPAGTKVRGHVERIEAPQRGVRVGAALAGDFTPNRLVVLSFDRVMLNGGEVVVQTIVSGGTENVKRLVAGGTDQAADNGIGARARGEIARQRDEIKQAAKDTLSAIKQPGRMQRLRDAAIRRLPYHPQYLTKGTIYNAELVSPLEFGVVTPIARAPSGTAPAPESILTARLATALDSAKTPRDTPIVAVLTEPVFSADHQLILAEGAELKGAVTFAKPASHFHRNGQLRFLFESVATTDHASTTLLASLYSVQAGAADHVAVDNEGGTTIDNSKMRFLAPALALVALSAAADLGAENPAEAGAVDIGGGSLEASNVGGRGLGGFYGLGLIGAGLSQLSRPVAFGLAAVGAVRTVYSTFFGMGRNVSFPADTPIQVQLAPGPGPVR
jgi:hypothetical protein